MPAGCWLRGWPRMPAARLLPQPRPAPRRPAGGTLLGEAIILLQNAQAGCLELMPRWAGKKGKKFPAAYAAGVGAGNGEEWLLRLYHCKLGLAAAKAAYTTGERLTGDHTEAKSIIDPVVCPGVHRLAFMLGCFEAVALAANLNKLCYP